MKFCYEDNDLRRINKKINIIIIKRDKTKQEQEHSTEKQFNQSTKNIIRNELSSVQLIRQIDSNCSDNEEEIDLKEDDKYEIFKKDISKQNVCEINSNSISNNINKNNEKFNEKKIVPKNIKLIKEITKDSYSDYTLDNTFITFTSINYILYLVYANNNKSIIFYNLLDNIKINEIKNAHKRDITNFRYYQDTKKKIDFLLSISLSDNNIKLWNVNNFECLNNFTNIYKSGKLMSACIFPLEENICIITSNAYGKNEPIKIFDINNNLIKDVNNSYDSSYFIDIFYDKKLCKNFIISCNNGYIKTYDYNENNLYHIYNDNDNKRHCSAVINEKNNITMIIESSFDGHIRVWDFHTVILMKKIKVSDNTWLFGICLWDSDNLLVGCGDKTMKVIELNEGVIAININNSFKNKVLTIKKINHPLYGECFISQGYEKEQIKLFVC